jgi:signal transduction histidine kinase
MLTWWRRLPLVAQDLALAAFTLTLGVLPWVQWNGKMQEMPRGLPFALALGVLTVALRRVAPLPALGVALTVFLWDSLAEATVLFPAAALAICAYSALITVEWLPLWSVGTALVALCVVGLVRSLNTGDTDVVVALNDTLPVLFVFVLSVGMAHSARRLQRSVQVVAQQNDELLRLRRSESNRAVDEERARIARELHDVVAQHVSAIVITANAGQRSAGRDRPELADSFGLIAASGRDALGSMRGLVSIIRREDDAGLAPQPDLDDLPELFESFRRMGVLINADVAAVERVPPSIGLTAFRVVQEALTNVLRHAPSRHAWVEISVAAGALTVVVDDDGGTAPDENLPDGGHGLNGMRERVDVVGGRLEISSGPRLGWRVRAILPLPAVSTAPLHEEVGP